MAKILVIDDDEMTRAIIKSLLNATDHEILEASSGNIGLALLESHSADLVVTDILMPEIDGLEVIRALKRNFPKVKIIAMSGGGRKGASYLPEAQDLGADATIQKPIEKAELLEQINSLLGN